MDNTYTEDDQGNWHAITATIVGAVMAPARAENDARVAAQDMPALDRIEANLRHRADTAQANYDRRIEYRQREHREGIHVIPVADQERMIHSALVELDWAREEHLAFIGLRAYRGAR